MSNSWLQGWLSNLNLPEYLETFSQNGYSSAEKLASIMDRDRLKVIGVTKMGHLSRLMRAIEKIRCDAAGGGGEEGMASSISPPLPHEDLGSRQGSGSSLVNSASSQMAVTVENSTPTDSTKSPPPVPKRKSMRRATSSPTSPTPIEPVPAHSSRGVPPPVQPRDQSLKRPLVTQRTGTKSTSNLLSPVMQPPGNSSEHPLQSNGPTPDANMSPTKLPGGSPTPKPRQKHPPLPVPRKRSGSKQPPTTSPERDVADSGNAKTLPAKLEVNGQIVSRRSPSKSPTPELLSSTEPDSPTVASRALYNTMFAQENVPRGGGVAAQGPRDQVPPLPPKTDVPSRPLLPRKDSGPPPFAPPPLPPERKYFKTDSAPSGSPPLPKKTVVFSEPTQPPLVIRRKLTPDGKSGPGPIHPKPSPRFSTLPAKRVCIEQRKWVCGESGEPLTKEPLRILERVDSLMDSEDDEDEKMPQVIKSGSLRGDNERLEGVRDVSVSDEEDENEKPPQVIRSTSLRGDNIERLEGIRDLSDEEDEEEDMPQVIRSTSLRNDNNQRLEGVCDLSASDEEDEQIPQVIKSTSLRGDNVERLEGVRELGMSDDTPPSSTECSPKHSSSSLIRQQMSGSNIADDDIIMTKASPQELDHDYMNQSDVDENLSDVSSNSEDDREERHTGAPKRLIVSQKSDEQDMILGVSVATKEANPDYMNQDAIDDMGANPDYMNQEAIDKVADNPDYMNQVAIDEIGANPDYMNQVAIDKVGVKGSADYMNQALIDQTVRSESAEMADATETWKAIEFMNQDIMHFIQSEVNKGKDYMNQSVIDSTLGGIVDNPDLYDTEDDLTEDDVEDSDNGKVRIHSYKEPLQIRGTSPIKSRTMGADPTNLDYENQDILDGDIIPMVVASMQDGSAGGEIKHMVPDVPVQVSDDNWNSAPQLGLKTEAEASGSVPSTSHDTTDDMDTPRASFCTSDFEESATDFSCKRGPTVKGGARDPGPRSLQSSPQLMEPVATKPRSHTDANMVNPGPHPLNLYQGSCRSQADMSTTSDSISTISSSSQLYGLGSQGSTTSSQATTPSSLEMDLSGRDIFNSRESRDPNNRDYIPAHLPKSAGTFAGVEVERRKHNYRKMQSIADGPYNSGIRNSMLSDASSLTESLLPGFQRLGTASADDVPKTKEGFLFKKGGRRNERPWQKRWVVFNGSELKYFKNKSDRDNLCLNTVELEKMIDVKRMPDEYDKQFRFDLVVINRIFQFYCDSLDDCQMWVNVLHVAISKYKPQDHEHKEGGKMHDPDRHGYLQKQGHGAFSGKTFKERYVALKGSKFAYYETLEDFKQGKPINTLDMSLSSVRPDMTSKLPRFILTMSNQKQYYFQTSTDLERNQWIESISMAIMTGLDLRQQTIPREKGKKSQDVLSQIQANPTNKTCADCSAPDPDWGVINRGIMICIKCSGVHRHFGTHLSKVRSIGLDEEIWTNQDLINLMVQIGNDNSSRFWEHHYQGQRLPADVEDEIRENFLSAKYVTRSWIPQNIMEAKDAVDQLLCENVATDNLMKTIELIALGANTCHLLRDVEDPEKSTPLAIARSSNQPLQAKLLELNGATICRKEDRLSFSIVSKKGYLHKTDTARTGWKKRYCSLDQVRGFEYFKTETDSELQGYIRVEEMFSVAKSEEEGPRDAKYRNCFEVNTRGRGYLFAADTQEEMEDWVATFGKIINSDTADNLGYDKVGYLKKKDPLNVTGWKRRWFTLKGKSLSCYKKEREELDEIDLRKVVELRGPESLGTQEQQCIIQIITDERTYQLKAESPTEAESWMSALRHTQVSGIPLSGQQLTSTGIPIVIHKCLQFIESIGLDVEGLYRISGEKTKIRKLILAFNQDARGVVIDPDHYTVHDVTSTLKQFLRSLPDPVLTHARYNDFIAVIQSVQAHEPQMYQIQTLIDQLPSVNRETLKRICGHLKRVVENESKNKMSLSNIIAIFAPTLMTVDADPVSITNSQYEYTCVHNMIKFYVWLFRVAAEENRKDEAIEDAMQRIKEAELNQKRRAELMSSKQSSMSGTTGFLNTIYINGKIGDTYNLHVTGVSTVQEVVEEVVAHKELPPDTYALYLVLGDSESHRVLCFSERLLAVICSAGTDYYLCLQRNAFYDTLSPYFGVLGKGEPVHLHVREKKKWKKYPCCVRDGFFIQFKDAKCHNELYKLSFQEFDIFVGIQQSKIDVRNPMPTRHSFWLKATKGDEMCKFLCADTKDDMLKLIAAVVRAKFSSCLQTPVLPANTSSPPPYSQSPNFNPSPELGNSPYNTSPPLR